MPVAEHVSESDIVTGTKDLRELAGRPRLFSYRRDGRLTAGTTKLLFHLLQRCSDDVVVMHVWTDGLDGVEPQAVYQVEVAGCKRRWVGAKVVGVGAAASVIDHEPDVERFRFVGTLPRFSKETRLVGR
jgi:hypothetical protein